MKGRMAEWEAIPEWPKGYRKTVRAMNIAWHAPHHVGVFRDEAFPVWWQRLRLRLVHPWITVFPVLLAAFLFAAVLTSLNAP